MPNKTAIEMLEKVQAVRKWGKENLPFYDSVIANDLIIFLAIEFVSGKPLSVKRLFASLPYSYTALRQYYKKLFEDGWVRHESDGKDRRIKYIKPSAKFIEVIDRYVHVIKTAFIAPPRTLVKFKKNFYSRRTATGHSRPLESPLNLHL